MPPISRRSFLSLLSLVLAPLCAQESAAKPKTPKQWKKLENVTWVPQRWNDGDSFHVKT